VKPAPLGTPSDAKSETNVVERRGRALAGDAHRLDLEGRPAGFAFDARDYRRAFLIAAQAFG
jgi:hypothetical protein